MKQIVISIFALSLLVQESGAQNSPTHIVVIKDGVNREECLQKIQETKTRVLETLRDGKIVFVDLLSGLESLDCVQSIQKNDPVGPAGP